MNRRHLATRKSLVKRHIALSAFTMLAIGCQGSQGAPKAAGSAPAALPAAPAAAKAPRPEPATRAPVTSSTPTSNASTTPRIAHVYHRVYDDWASVVCRKGRPLLLSMSGAIDLTTGQVQFEREPRNFGIYEGASVWFADRFSPMSACPEPAVLAQLVGEKWVPRLDINVHDLRVRPWVQGSSLAAVVPKRLGPPWGYELLVLEKNRTPPRPERSGPSRQEGCYTRLDQLEALEAFPSGEIFVFGHQCPLLPKESENEVAEADSAAAAQDEADPEANIVVESFAKGARRSTFTMLPLRELTSTFGVSASDIWATGSVSDTEWRIAHFDGASWTLLPERFQHEVHSLIVPEGETGVGARRFFIVDTELIEVAQGATKKHALPTDCTPLTVQLQNEQLWVLCDVGQYDTALFTTDPNIRPVRFAEDDPDRPLVSWSELRRPQLDPRRPPSAGCSAPRAPQGKSKLKVASPDDFGF